MFEDDGAAHRALRTLNDDPAPPITTTIDEVLRRGRRRVFVQRAAAVAGAVAVVAAIGVMAVLLRPAEQSGGGVQVADSTTPTMPTAPTAPTTSTAPASPEGALPGWQLMPIDEVACKVNPLPKLHGTPPDALLPQAVVQPAFNEAVESITGAVANVGDAIWMDHSPKANGPRGYLVVEIPMDNGNGQLQLEAEVYPGSPEEMADASLYSYGDCKPPSRRVLDDGTVLQLFQADFYNPEQPTQHLQVYRPDGRIYVVTAAGWSEADMVPVGEGASTIEGGRGKLPTTGKQLAEIATGLVANLG